MNNPNYFDLTPRYDSRQSFYGKAKVLIVGQFITLKSYDTEIITIDTEKHTFIKKWSNWSHTTGRHIVEFARQYDLPISCKADYSKLDTFKEYNY